MLIRPKLTAPFQRGLMPGIVRAVATTLRTRKVTKKAGLLTLRVEAHAYGSVERAKGTKRTLRRAAGGHQLRQGARRASQEDPTTEGDVASGRSAVVAGTLEGRRRRCLRTGRSQR